MQRVLDSYNVVANNVTFRRNHCCRGKAISITYSECVFVALVTQHEKRMRSVMLSVTCPAVPYFSALSHINGTILGKEVEQKMCVLII